MNRWKIVSIALAAALLGSFATLPAEAAVKYIKAGLSNSTTATTTIKNTKGTALSLVAPSNKAPLAVSNSNLVAKLNADKLDGLHASSFARRIYTGVLMDVIPRYDGALGQYVMEVWCPKGSVRVGGGSTTVTDTSANPITVESSFPIQGKTLSDPGGWRVASNSLNPAAYVICLSTNGKPIPGTNVQ